MKTKMAMREWLPLAGLAVSAFVFNSSEFMPIGLLTGIAEEFQITEAHAGIMITAYSWAVMLLSLPLMLLVGKMDYRKLLLGVLALFGVSQVLSGLSPSYPLLVLSRIGVACAHAIFWSIASPMAVRLVSEQHRSFALSMIVTGTSVAMIFGLPLGRVIGLYLGWRVTFYCVAAFAFAIFLYLFAVFPKITQSERFQPRQLPELFRIPKLVRIYVLTFLTVTAYYTAYSYIEPFLMETANLSDQWTTIVLTVFGAAGILGSVLFSMFYEKNPRRFTGSIIVAITVVLLLMRPAAIGLPTILALCAVWGIAVMAFNVTFQAKVIQAAPQAASSIAMSIYSSIFNFGIGSGTWIGGVVCTAMSVADIGFVGGVIGILAAGYYLLVCERRVK